MCCWVHLCNVYIDHLLRICCRDFMMSLVWATNKKILENRQMLVFGKATYFCFSVVNKFVI